MPAGEKKEGTIQERLEASLGGIVLLHEASHPTRYMIMKAIEEKALYINQLCRRLGLGRRIITFHLIDLEKLKLIETYWNPLPSSQHKKQMTLARFVKLTPKGKTVLKDVDGYLDTLKPTHHA